MKKSQRSNVLMAAAFVAVALIAAGGAAYLRTRPDEAVTAVPAAELARTTLKSDVVPGDHCPTLTSWVVAPLQTSVGSWIDVSAAAVDVDPDEHISYEWAPSGGFESPGSASTRYRCAEAGTQSLLLRVSDDHHPRACSTWFKILVDCLAT